MNYLMSTDYLMSTTYMDIGHHYGDEYYLMSPEYYFVGHKILYFARRWT